MDHYQAALFFVALSFFTGWLSILSYQLKKMVNHIEENHDIEDTRDTINQMAQALAIIYENMPTIDRIQEMVPQFSINQQEAGSKHFFDFVGKLLNVDALSTQTQQRDDRGQFYATPPQIENTNPTQGQTDA
jgi:hypothetical protein